MKINSFLLLTCIASLSFASDRDFQNKATDNLVSSLNSNSNVAGRLTTRRLTFDDYEEHFRKIKQQKKELELKEINAAKALTSLLRYNKTPEENNSSFQDN